jgi:ATP-dependent RNA helicase RhlE
MLDMGFSEQLSRILEATPKTRQTLLFSATLAKPVEKLAARIMKDQTRIQVGHSVSPAKTVEQKFVMTTDEGKLRELDRILRSEPGSIFIFVRSKLGVDRLWRMLSRKGFNDATRLHSDLRQKDREQSLEDFKNGQYRVMIATDVAGRGIHVEGVSHVVNYDLPRDPEDYVHRIGRTGRAEATGKATSLITAKDSEFLRELEKMIGRRIEVADGLPAARGNQSRRR